MPCDKRSDDVRRPARGQRPAPVHPGRPGCSRAREHRERGCYGPAWWLWGRLAAPAAEPPPRAGPVVGPRPPRTKTPLRGRMLRPTRRRTLRRRVTLSRFARVLRLVEPGELLRGEVEVGGCCGVADRPGSLCTRDGDDDRGLCELPRERDLLRADIAAGGDFGERGMLVGELLGVPQPTQGTPRQEREPELVADVDLRATAAEGGQNWFCTLTSASPSTLWAARIWSGSALDSPTMPTLPESAISFRVPITSS